ncbi:MAG: glycosyltransferase [Acholeplasmatales bacterium]|nr:glycosyltransferase [Acholeplasmatales bacterium]
MNIGLFTDQYYPAISGVVTSITMLYEGLEALGHKCFIFTSYDEKSLTENEKEEIKKKSVINIKGIPYPFKSIKQYHFSFFYGKAVKEVAKYNLDIIHVQTEYYLSKVAIKASKKLNIPLVHTLHTSWKDYLKYVFPITDKYFHRPLLWLERKMFLEPISKASVIDIIPNKKVIQDLPLYGMDVNKIAIIPTGIELERFKKKYSPDDKIKELREKLGINDDAFVFAYIGRASDEKNIENLIEAFTYALNGKNAYLVVVGGGPSLEALKQNAEDYVVKDQVIFTGQIPWTDIPLYYHMSNIFLNASKSETQGLTYIEALSSGTPALVQKDEVIENVIIDAYNGYTFDGVDDLVEKMQYVYENPNELKKLMKNAIESTKKYSKEVFTDTILKLYNESIEKYNNSRN